MTVPCRPWNLDGLTSADADRIRHDGLAWGARLLSGEAEVFREAAVTGCTCRRGAA